MRIFVNQTKFCNEIITVYGVRTFYLPSIILSDFEMVSDSSILNTPLLYANLTASTIQYNDCSGVKLVINLSKSSYDAYCIVPNKSPIGFNLLYCSIS